MNQNLGPFNRISLQTKGQMMNLPVAIVTHGHLQLKNRKWI